MITFYNCNGLDIRSTIDEGSHSNKIVIQGNENYVFGYSKSNFRIEGNNNTATIAGSSFISIEGNDNIIEANDNSICNCESGEGNVINLYGSAYGYICGQCVKTYATLKEKSRIRNFSFTSSIFCFGKSVCETVKCPKIETFQFSTMINLSDRGGKTLCREPNRRRQWLFL